MYPSAVAPALDADEDGELQPGSGRAASVADEATFDRGNPAGPKFTPIGGAKTLDDTHGQGHLRNGTIPDLPFMETVSTVRSAQARAAKSSLVLVYGAAAIGVEDHTRGRAALGEGHCQDVLDKADADCRSGRACGHCRE